MITCPYSGSAGGGIHDDGEWNGGSYTPPVYTLNNNELTIKAPLANFTGPHHARISTKLKYKVYFVGDI